jgi:hypothetical protein
VVAAPDEHRLVLLQQILHHRSNPNLALSRSHQPGPPPFSNFELPNNSAIGLADCFQESSKQKRYWIARDYSSDA